MSPNLSSAHFKQNAQLYEQVVYSVLSLVGVASRLSEDLRHLRYVRPCGGQGEWRVVLGPVDEQDQY